MPHAFSHNHLLTCPLSKEDWLAVIQLPIEYQIPVCRADVLAVKLEFNAGGSMKGNGNISLKSEMVKTAKPEKNYQFRIRIRSA